MNRFTEPVHISRSSGGVRLRVDVHQHLWPEPLLRALARRRGPPSLVRRAAGWTLRLRGAADAPLALADHDPDHRSALLDSDGVDRALVALSSPMGIEGLPAAEAAPLLAAYHEGVAELPARFGAWAAIGLAEPDSTALSRLLDLRFAGASVPACALGDAAGYERLGPVLETLERRGAPLLVHPGPAQVGARSVPCWWPALTDYVVEMQRAWYAFAVWGRPAHPRLRACFVMLAGLAPLQRERLVARGGRTDRDPEVFLETSSYGARAVDAVIREVGVDCLVYGSDRPVIAPGELALGDAVDAALRERNTARLLGHATVEDMAA